MNSVMSGPGPVCVVAGATVTGASLAPLVMRYRRLAHSDPLTGLLNRRGLESALRAGQRGGRRRAPGLRRRTGAPRWIAVMDLTGFKHVNETCGYPQGDALLVTVASALRDSLPSSAAVARVGGDEFVVLGDGASPCEGAWLLDVRAKIGRGCLGLEPGTGAAKPTVGLDVACQPVRVRDSASALDRAWSELYARRRQRAAGGPGAATPIWEQAPVSVYPDGGLAPPGAIAPLAQSAERLHGKEKVYGSIP